MELFIFIRYTRLSILADSWILLSYILCSSLSYPYYRSVCGYLWWIRQNNFYHPSTPINTRMVLKSFKSLRVLNVDLLPAFYMVGIHLLKVNIKVYVFLNSPQNHVRHAISDILCRIAWHTHRCLEGGGGRSAPGLFFSHFFENLTIALLFLRFSVTGHINVPFTTLNSP